MCKCSLHDISKGVFTYYVSCCVYITVVCGCIYTLLAWLRRQLHFSLLYLHSIPSRCICTKKYMDLLLHYVCGCSYIMRLYLHYKTEGVFTPIYLPLHCNIGLYLHIRRGCVYTIHAALYTQACKSRVYTYTISPHLHARAG